MKEKLKLSKFIFFSLTVACMANIAVSAQERFSQLRKVEAYEIRPGILLMPRYTASNELCEIGIERLQYSPTLVNLNLDVSREGILQIIDDQVPISERGALSQKDSGDELRQSGTIRETTSLEYENVSIRIYSVPFPSRYKGGIEMKAVVATAKWKHRQCR